MAYSHSCERALHVIEHDISEHITVVSEVFKSKRSSVFKVIRSGKPLIQSPICSHIYIKGK